jgi:hypothetical protein
MGAETPIRVSRERDRRAEVLVPAVMQLLGVLNWASNGDADGG